MLITRLLLVVQVWDGKPIFRKSWARKLLVWSGFELGALLEGRMWSFIPIMVYISLIIGCRGLDVKTTYGKSCAQNFWVGSDLSFEPSFKVECGP